MDHVEIARQLMTLAGALLATKPDDGRTIRRWREQALPFDDEEWAVAVAIGENLDPDGVFRGGQVALRNLCRIRPKTLRRALDDLSRPLPTSGTHEGRPALLSRLRGPHGRVWWELNG